MKIILTTLFAVALLNNSYNQINFIYGKQFGTVEDENSRMLAVDAIGNVYLAGYTKGTLINKSFGKSDGFLSKYDSQGNHLWTKQFGSEQDEDMNRIIIDENENLILAGTTNGVIGDKSFGKQDIIVAKYNTDGDLLWQKQLGSDSTESSPTIAADKEDNIYLTANTTGVFGEQSYGRNDGILVKLDKDGDTQFIEQFGTKGNDKSGGIHIDNNSDILIIGNTNGTMAEEKLGRMDIFLLKYSGAGELLASRQLGSAGYELGQNVITDSDNNVYLGCSSGGNMAGKQKGQGDCVLIKMDSDLNTLWQKQFGTPGWDGINGIAFNSVVSENIVISGCQNWPNCQAFCRVYSKDGDLLGVNNFTSMGEGGGTCGKGIFLANDGSMYHVGHTGGNLFGSLQGEHDIFLIKLKMDENIYED